jgi:hypothetical protein
MKLEYIFAVRTTFVGWIRRLFAAQRCCFGVCRWPGRAAGESDRCKVWAWEDVRRSIDPHITVYLYDNRTVYRT